MKKLLFKLIRKYYLWRGLELAEVVFEEQEGTRYRYALYLYPWTTQEDCYSAIAKGIADGSVDSGRITINREKLDSLFK